MPSHLLVLLVLLTFTTIARPISDQQILLDLKRSFRNYTDGFFDKWTPNNPPCEFTGVTCDSTRNVTEVDLTDGGISGTFPFASVCQLPFLTKLSLGNNYISGNVSAELRSCRKLKHLDLTDNSFAGEIPDLSPLVKLEVLNLSGNGFTGRLPGYFLKNLTELIELALGDNPFDLGPIPEEILQLTKLTSLYLSNCSIEGEIPPGIGNLKGLVDLQLADNYLTGSIPEELTTLANLSVLELYDNGLTGTLPAGFGNLWNLTFLDASSNQLRGNLSEIRFLTKLVSLQLFNNSFSGEIPAEVGDFKDLTNVSLYMNQLTGEVPRGIGSWSDFTYIDVSTNKLTGPIPPDMCKQGKMELLLMLENNFTGGIPESYGNCRSLVRLRVSGNSLSGEVPEGVWSLPNLDIIDMAMNDFSGLIGVGIGKAKSLTQLFAFDNRFSGELPPEISAAENLVTVDLRSNKFYGEIPNTIGNLKSLNSLLLSSNEISGNIPSSLGDCSSLNELNLAGNAISGRIPSSFGNLHVLNSLNLSNNHLSGEIPSSISSLRLSSLDLSNNDLAGEIPQALAITGTFAGNPRLCSNNPRLPSLPHCSIPRHSPARLRVALSVVLALAAAAVAVIALLRFLRKRNSSSESRQSSWDMKSFRIVTFDEREIVNGVTDANLIGKGGSGYVYKVRLSSGKTVAVKHIWNRSSAVMVRREFEAEVGTLSSIRHVNVVKLYCSVTSEDSSLLVYEYLRNGSLWDRLHGVEKRLGWTTRYDVAVGSARGLEYLHHGCKRPILHRDVKSSNILLDEAFMPRIADFGLAKIIHGAKDDSTRVIAGTLGYIAPEYAYTYKVSEKSDVYSFGVVLMELVTGRRPIEPEFGESKDIVNWVYNKMAYREEMVWLLDPTIPKEFEEEAVRVLKVGVLCTVRLPSLRPSMRTVVHMLEEAGQWRMITGMDEKRYSVSTQECENL